MDRTAAIAKLPDAYATALRLRDEDVGNEEIAARLGIELEAVAPLLRIAAAKLGAIVGATKPAPKPLAATGDSSEATDCTADARQPRRRR
jgi:hypothetical protein